MGVTFNARGRGRAEGQHSFLPYPQPARFEVGRSSGGSIRPSTYAPTVRFHLPAIPRRPKEAGDTSLQWSPGLARGRRGGFAPTLGRARTSLTSPAVYSLPRVAEPPRGGIWFRARSEDTIPTAGAPTPSPQHKRKTPKNIISIACVAASCARIAVAA